MMNVCIRFKINSPCRRISKSKLIIVSVHSPVRTSNNDHDGSVSSAYQPYQAHHLDTSFCGLPRPLPDCPFLR